MDVIAVDDDGSGLDLLRMLLESAGHRVRTSRDVAGACALLANEPLPEVVVTDLLFGTDQIGGHHLISTIRADPTYDSVGVVALTGVTSAHDLYRARLAGADACLAKPMDIDVFLETLESVRIGRSRPSGSESPV